MNLHRAATEPWHGPQAMPRVLTLLILGLLAWGPGLFVSQLFFPQLMASRSVLAVMLSMVISLTTIPFQGALLRIMRQGLVDSGAPLMPWMDGQGLLREGAMLWAVTTLWGLPAQLAFLFDDSSRLPLFTLFAVLITLVVFVVQPAASGRLAATGSLLAGLDTRTASATVRQNLRSYLALAGVSLALMIVFVPFGVALGFAAMASRGARVSALLPDPALAALGLGTLLVATYTACMIAHLVGQVFRLAEAGEVARAELQGAL